MSPDEAAIERFYALDRRCPSPLVRRFNVAPTTRVPIIHLDPDGLSELTPARWGLIPAWWRQPEPPRLTFNARGEEAATKPMWRQAYRQGRCLIPAEGWYEWRAQGEHVSGKVRKTKRPYFIHGESKPVIAFAGLAACWAPPEAEPLVSCAILTRPAAPSLQHIHPRMPVVLAPADLGAWLDPHLSLEAVGEILSRAQSQFQSYPVSTRVNDARQDSPSLIERVEGAD